MLYAIELTAVAVCAISGVLEAGRKEIDLFGTVVVALFAALGTEKALRLTRRGSSHH